MRSMLFIMFSFLLPAMVFAQTQPGFGNPEGLFQGGLGVTVIEEDGEETTYLTINLQPEVAFGKLGLGLNIDVLYNPNPEEGEDHIREDDLKFEKILRFVRWGVKRDPIYARVGALDNATLGHGFILAHYQNQIVENERKLGLAFDVNQTAWGFESMTSNFKRLELIGGRAYYRPLEGRVAIPIIKRMAFGATVVTDIDPDADRDSNDDVLVWGVDAELPILEMPMLDVMLYADFAQIRSYGSGAATGLLFRVPSLLSLMSASLKVEQRFLGEEFEANYFDAFYENDRAYKMQSLKNAEAVSGTFGELMATILGKITVIGSYEYYDENEFGGTAHAAAGLEPNTIPRVLLRGTYDKDRVETFEDLVTLDARSMANGYIGYGLNKYLYLTVNYQWTFSRDENDNLITQERIVPRLDFYMNF